MKIVFASIVFLMGQVSLAHVVTCSTIGKRPQKVIEYSFKETQSARLNSGILYTSSNGPIQFYQDSVAQYKNTKHELFLVVDNESERILVKMQGFRFKKDYRGRVVEMEPVTAKVIRKIEVTCDSSAN